MRNPLPPAPPATSAAVPRPPATPNQSAFASRALGHDDPIMTIKDVAADLSISRRTVYDWIHKGLLDPPQKLGLRRVGYRKSTIDQFKVSRPAAFRAQKFV
jgi:excisionase family DNA binding protein